MQASTSKSSLQKGGVALHLYTNHALTMSLKNAENILVDLSRHIHERHPLWTQMDLKGISDKIWREYSSYRSQPFGRRVDQAWKLIRRRCP